MEPIHRQIFEITAHHTDCFGRARASVLLHFAQEAAGQHCLTLGTDWDTLSKQHLFWAVIRQRKQIARLPGLGERLTVETWPMPTTRAAFPRSTVAYDAQGREVFRSISLWVLMDTRTRTMVLPAKSGIAVDGALRGTELAAPGSITPRTLHNTQTRSVCFTDLDRNGHMNNARYLDWVDDLLPSAYHKDHPLQELTVCYLAETLENDRLDLHWELDESGNLQVDAFRENTDVHEKSTRVFTGILRY